MTARPVEAVFYWRYNVSAYRAAYGRLPGTKYTKDFLQSGVTQYPDIDRVLPRTEGNDPGIRIVWPGGERKAYWKRSPSTGDDRCRLGWETNNGPTPWKVGDISSTNAITIPGDPTQVSEKGAESAWDELEALTLEPVILAIKLAGEDRVLHARAYLEKPTGKLKYRGISQLPKQIRDHITSNPKDTGAILLAPSVSVRAPELVRRILDALAHEPNVLVVGPPGTGKSVALEDLRAIYEGKVQAISFDPDKWDDAWSELTPSSNESKVVSLVFHPSFSFEDFVGGLIPAPKDGAMELSAVPGPLLCLAHYCEDPQRLGILLLDEFNRAPVAAVFGSILALLDKEKRASPDQPGVSITRPHPGHKMTVPATFKNKTGVEIDEEVSLPASLKIVAALNSTDRSVAPLDAALRRRFAIIQVRPDLVALARNLGTSWPRAPGELETLPASVTEWNVDQARGLTVRVLDSVNARIESLLGEDFLLGHALLWSVKGNTATEVFSSLAKAFDEKIAATLRMTFADQDDALAAVLKVGPSSGSTVGDHRIARWIQPPQGLEAVASPRLRIEQVQPLGSENAAIALRALL